jgi:ketosteroid isomerase-like protein
MSRENVELIQRFYGRVQADPSVWDELLDADAEFDVRELNPEGGTPFRGPDGAKEFFRRWIGAFQEWDYDVVEMIDEGTLVAACIHQRGRGKASGAMVRQAFWQIWTIRDGKAVHVTHVNERADALAALGMAPS